MSEHLDIETPGGTWAIDTSPCSAFLEQSNEVQVYAATLAANWLYRLTGRRFGTKTIQIRPCRQDSLRFSSTYQGRSGTRLVPISGALITRPLWGTFACSDCFTDDASTLILPATPAISLEDVTVDGSSIDLETNLFHIFDHQLLVGPSDFTFPRSQDINLPDTEEGTWSVTYTHGTPVPRDGEFAAGFLANELAKACAGLQCSLPRRVQSIARQGVTIQIVDNPDFLRDGLVGLTEVDQFIVSVNPHGLHSSSRSYNPDTLRNRAKQPTWPAP